MATRKDVAKLAGVSESAVSHALRNAPYARLSPETRRRIREAAAQLGYRPHHAASTLASGKTKQIAVVFYHHSYFTDPLISPNFLTNVIVHAARRGLRITVATTTQAADAPELYFLDLLRAQAIDGAIIHDHAMPRDCFWEMQERGLPFVSIEWAPEGLEEHVVPMEHRASFTQASQEIAARGYDWLCYLCNPPVREPMIRPLSQACEIAGIPLVTWDLKGIPLSDAPTIRKELMRLFGQYGQAGVFYASYRDMFLMQQIARDAKIPVPERLGFLSDGIVHPYLDGDLPGGIIAPGDVLAERAVERLCWLMNGKATEIDDTPVVTTFIPGALLRKPLSRRSRRAHNNEGTEVMPTD